MALILNFAPDGTATAVEGEAADLLRSALSLQGERRRASHVLPVAFPLRSAFRLLRSVFGEVGRAATWTRSWRCQWYVDLSPVGGPLLQGFANRADAIQAEVAYLSEHPDTWNRPFLGV